MDVRRELPEDAAAVRTVHTAAFGRDGERDVAEARLVDALRRDGDALPALCLVATIGHQVVGHVACSRAAIDDLPSIGLGPLGVLPAHQGRGVGLALLHAVLGAADALDAPEVVLLGAPDYYRRAGFELAAPLGVTPPDPAWADHLQVRRLGAWTPVRRGAFRYAPAFDRL